MFLCLVAFHVEKMLLARRADHHAASNASRETQLRDYWLMMLVASTRQHLRRHLGPDQALPFVLVYRRVLGFEAAFYSSLYKSGEVLHISYEVRLCQSLRLPQVSKTRLRAGSTDAVPLSWL